jgi:CoA:oxalate CoA-transferase
MAARRENREAVLAAVSGVLANDTSAAWVARLAPLGIVVSGIESLEQALASEQTRARAMVAQLETPAGPLRMVGNPIKLPGLRERLEPPPQLGADQALVARMPA